MMIHIIYFILYRVRCKYCYICKMLLCVRAIEFYTCFCFYRIFFSSLKGRFSQDGVTLNPLDLLRLFDDQ